MAPQRRINERGFIVYDEFEDDYGAKVRIQESSSAEEPKVWLFTKEGSSEGNDGAVHMTEVMAARVRDALNTFIREIPQRWKDRGSAL